MHIQISKATRNRLLQYPEYRLRPRGPVTIKGKGEMYNYWLVGKQGVYDFSKFIQEGETDSTGGAGQSETK